MRAEGLPDSIFRKGTDYRDWKGKEGGAEGEQTKSGGLQSGVVGTTNPIKLNRVYNSRSLKGGQGTNEDLRGNTVGCETGGRQK